jgi:hypothetical protein
MPKDIELLEPWRRLSLENTALAAQAQQTGNDSRPAFTVLIGTTSGHG